MPVHTQTPEGNGLLFGGCQDERGANNERVKIDEEAETRRKALKDHDPFSRLEGKSAGSGWLWGRLWGSETKMGRGKYDANVAMNEGVLYNCSLSDPFLFLLVISKRFQVGLCADTYVMVCRRFLIASLKSSHQSYLCEKRSPSDDHI